MSSRTRTAALTVVVAGALVLTGCGGGTPAPTASTPSAGSGASAASADHAPADVAFARDMTPHHQQAVAMTDLAATRAAAPGVRDLSGRIAAGQGPEIAQMTGMLDAWGEPRPQPGAMGSMAMSGMMSDQQMAGLATLSGPAFDRAFLTMMTEHHRGAVEMARAELAAGVNPQARALAQTIITAQEAEIAEMARLLPTA